MITRRTPPPYFAAIRAEVAANWDTLEQNPVLAAPWWQLFRQIKSPYHVLSEVLQNADDAEATWARAWIEDGAFCFEHNGGDFAAEHLQSLCRFGFSNKRSLHTIGFRGLGFKSLFSYGSRVELTTPTLAIVFNETRFTESVWINDATAQEHTRIRVELADERIQERVKEDMERWADNPVPLLFFRSIRELSLGERTVSRTDGDPGPAARSAWVELRGAETDRVLVVRSAEMKVPDDAMDEIRQERGDPAFDLPGVSVDLVVGLADPDRLYVVLPTNVELPIPFSCNAPFVQDPARSGIKDPANSPLNRWLLARVGALAAETLVAWGGNAELPLQQRAEAYDNLLPDAHPAAGNAGAVAAREIVAAMAPVLASTPAVLSVDGTLVRGTQAVDLPSAIAQVWPPADALQIFGIGARALVAAELSDLARQRLALWAGLARLKASDIAEKLQFAIDVPRPSLEQVAVLWAYLEPTISRNRWSEWIRQLKIVPVSGETTLQWACQLTNFGSGSAVLGNDDWSFLRSLVSTVDADWVAQLQVAHGAGGDASPTLRASVAVLQLLKLDQPATVALLIEHADNALGYEPDTVAGIRLAHVAARADITVHTQFRYRTADQKWRDADGTLLLGGGAHDDLLPEPWREKYTLHTAYEAALGTNQLKTWRKWITSAKSRIRAFPLPSAERSTIHGRQRAASVCASRGSSSALGFQLKTYVVELADYDFASDLWSHWSAVAMNDPGVWARIVNAIGAEWSSATEQAAVASLYQSSPKYRYKVDSSDMPAAWLHRLRSLPCVLDERGLPSAPDALLRYTPDTAFMQGAARFVHPSMDRHEVRPLLDLLGVRAHALSAETLLTRLRALAKASTPPTHAVLPLYNALDQLAARLPAADMESVRDVFANEALTLSDDLTWHQSSSIYQRNDEGLPGAATLWPPCSGLALWQRLDVHTRPSMERLLAWLSTLPSGDRLEDLQRRRVRELLAVMPRQIWEMCGAWLDLGGRWVSASALRWRVARISSAEGLFPKIRHATADLSMVADAAVHAEAFTELVPLERALVRRAVSGLVHEAARPAWLDLLAAAAIQVTARNPSANSDAVRSSDDEQVVARKLATARWRVAEQLAVTPFLGLEQAGVARSVRAAWDDDALYVCGTAAHHHRALVDELCNAFTDVALRNAFADCVGRDTEWVRDYLFDQLGVDPNITLAPTNSPSGAANEIDTVPSIDATPGRLPQGTLLAAPVSPTAAASTEHLRAAVAGLAHTAAETAGAGSDTVPPLVASVTQATVGAHSRSAPRWRIAATGILIGLGFVEVSETTWTHSDGRRAEIGGDLLHLLLTNSAGRVVARYWVGDGRLNDGVVVPAAIWNLLARSPSESWIVLPDDERALRGFSVQEIGNRLDVKTKDVVHRAAGKREAGG